MLQLDITVKEAKLLEKMLAGLSDDYGNAGCNDMEYPRTWSKKDQTEFGEKIRLVTGNEDEGFQPEYFDINVLEYFQERLKEAIEAAK